MITGYMKVSGKPPKLLSPMMKQMGRVSCRLARLGSSSNGHTIKILNVRKFQATLVTLKTLWLLCNSSKGLMQHHVCLFKWNALQGKLNTLPAAGFDNIFMEMSKRHLPIVIESFLESCAEFADCAFSWTRSQLR